MPVETVPPRLPLAWVMPLEEHHKNAFEDATSSGYSSGSATQVALASSRSTSAVQTCLYHVQVTTWSGPQVLGRWCPASCWQRTASPSISQLQNVRCPRTQNSFGDRQFSVAGPRIWNDLPPELRHVDISGRQFSIMMKSYLFRF